MDEKIIGQEIKQHRLALNLSMDYVARKVNITRATLWAIEKGRSNSSFSTYLHLMELLGISLEFKRSSTTNIRFRATRRITALDKKINEFIIMCIELYASYKNKNASEIHKLFKKNGLIDLLNSDYEDMHGMSTESLNEYFDASLNLVKSHRLNKEDHSLAKTIIVSEVTKMIANKYKVSLEEARDMFYQSKVSLVLSNDDTGLFGDSPLSIFALFEQLNKQ